MCGPPCQLVWGGLRPEKRNSLSDLHVKPDLNVASLNWNVLGVKYTLDVNDTTKKECKLS